MYHKFYNFYCFINNYDFDFINKLPEKVSIIYRNYNKIKNIDQIIKIKKFCKKSKRKFFISNDIKLAIKLDLDGIYIPSFNKSLNIKFFKTKKNFIYLGSAHNILEINQKIKQNIDNIFLSPLFIKKNNRQPLGIYRYIKLIKKDINFICLGGINYQNIKKINLIKPFGIASISLFKNKLFYNYL